MEPGKEKVTYVKMTPEKAVKVVNDHLVNGNVVTEYTIGSMKRNKEETIHVSFPRAGLRWYRLYLLRQRSRSSKPWKREIKDNGLAEEVKVIKTGCFGLCALGPIMIVYPEGCLLFRMVKPEDIPEIVAEHLLKGRIVTRLLYQETVQEDTVSNL